MDYKDIYKVVTFLVDKKEEENVNKLLERGWKILDVIQYKDEHKQHGQYILGITKETYDKFNDVTLSNLKKGFMLEDLEPFIW